MRRMRFATCAALALACFGCLRESTIEPVRDTVMIHAMATVGDSVFAVAMTHVSNGGVQTPLENALVSLRRDGVDVPLTRAGETSAFCFPQDTTPVFEGEQRSAGQCYAAALASPIQPGEMLDLTIELADGTRIVGSTTTPAAPVIEMPAAGSELDVDIVVERIGSVGFALRPTPIEVRWTGTDGQPADLLLEVEALFDDGAEVDCGDFFVDRPEHARSPASVRAPSFCDAEPEDPVWDSAYVRLHVVGYDANALDYIAAVNDNGTGIVLDGASPGLEVVEGDALVSGVFGSAADAIAPLTLRAVLIDERVNGNRGSGARARAAAARGSGSRRRS